MSKPVRRFGYLDSLRLIAAVFVVFQHLSEHRGGFVSDYISPLGIGLAGVAVFFFISGYVVPLSTGGKLEIRSFMVKRMFRLYPLYLASLLFLIILATSTVLPQWGFMLEASLWTWLANLLLIQDFVGAQPFLGVSWTLIIEIIWYSLFALSVVLFKKRAGDILDIVMPVTLLAMAVASLAMEMRLPLGRPMMVYATVMGYQFYRHAVGETSDARLARSLGVFVAVIVFSYWVAFGVFAHPRMSFAQALGPWLIGTSIFATILLVEPIRTSDILNDGWLPRLGVYSYSIYLLHPVAIALASTYADGPLRAPVAIALTAALAFAGFQLVEKPGIAWGRRAAKWVEPGRSRQALS
jgi:peptidoglycan/LPS O-acetylase OafA/YrhL